MPCGSEAVLRAHCAVNNRIGARGRSPEVTWWVHWGPKAQSLLLVTPGTRITDEGIVRGIHRPSQGSWYPGKGPQASDSPVMCFHAVAGHRHCQVTGKGHEVWAFPAGWHGARGSGWEWWRPECQAPGAPKAKLGPKAHPSVKKDSHFPIVWFLSAGQVLLNGKVSTIGGNYTVSCSNGL